MPTLAELQLVLTAEDRGATTSLVQLQGGITGVTQSAPGMGSALAAGLGLPVTPAMALVQATNMVKDAVVGMVSSSLEMNQKLDTAQKAFTNMFGSAQQAGNYLRQLQQFANTTPFEFEDVERGAQRFMGMGLAAERVIPIMTDIGNAVAKVGGSKEEINRVEVAISQIVAKGKVSAQEMNQLAENGIAGWRILADSLHRTVAQVMADAAAGKVSAEQFLAAFHQANIGDAMAAQSHTFSGAMSTVKDSFNLALAQGLRPFYDLATKIANQLATWMQGSDFQHIVQQIGVWLKGAADAVEEFGRGLAQVQTQAAPLIADLQGLADSLGRISSDGSSLSAALGPLSALMQAQLTLTITLVDTFVKGVKTIVDGAGQIGGGIKAMGQQIMQALTPAMGAFVQFATTTGLMSQEEGTKVRQEWTATANGVSVAAVKIVETMKASGRDMTLAQAQAFIDSNRIQGQFVDTCNITADQVKAAADKAAADMKAAYEQGAAQSAALGKRTVDNWLGGMVEAYSSGYPQIDAYIKDLLKRHDFQGALLVLGENDGKAFISGLVKAVANGVLGLANTLDKMFAGFKTLGIDPGIFGGDALRKEAASMLKTLDTTMKEANNIWNPPTPPKDKKPKVGPDPAKVQEDMDNIRRTLTQGLAQAAADTATGGAGVNTALSNMLKLTVEAAKLHLPQIPAEVDKQLKIAAAGGTVDAQALHDKIVGWLKALAKSGDEHTALFARAALENLDKLVAGAGAKLDKLDAATLKAQQAVLQNMGKMNESIQQGSATTGDVVVALMDGLDAATKAKMPQVAAAYQQALDQMQSATPPKLTDIQAEFVKTMQTLTHDPNASIAAWAQQQLDSLTKLVQDQKDADAKILAEQTQKWQEYDQKEREEWQKQIDAQRAAQAQLTDQMGQAARSMQDALLAGKGGGDLASQYKQMMDLANQAVAAGNTRLADQFRAAAAQIAQAGQGAGQGIYDSLIAALQAAAAQGDVTAGLIIQDLQRIAAQAAATKAENDSYAASVASLQAQEAAATATLQQYKDAVAGAQQELTGLKAAEEGAKAALDAAGQAVSAAKAQVQGLEQQYQAAQQALNDFKSAQLEGEGAASEAQFQNQQQQKQLQLQILNLQMGGATSSNPQLKALQAQLEQVRLAGEQMRLQAEVTFDPLHHALQAIGADQKELTFDEAKAGALGAQANMAKLNTELDASRRHLGQVEAAQASAQKAYNAASQAVKAQEAEVARLNEVLQQHEAEVKKQVDDLKAQETALKAQHDATLAAIADGQTLATSVGATTTAFATAATTIPTATQAVSAAVGAGAQGAQQAWDSVFLPDKHAAGGLLNKMFVGDGSFFGKLEQLTDKELDWYKYEIWGNDLNILKQFIVEALDKMQKPIKDSAHALGVQIDTGAAEGITEGQGALAQAMRTAVRNAIDAGAAEAESHSPSQASRRAIGVPLGQGVTVGVQDQIPAAGQAMTTLVHSTVQSIPGLTATVRQQLKGILDMAMRPGASWDSTVAALSTLHLGDSLTSRMDNILRSLFGGSLTGQGALDAFFAMFGQGHAGLLGPPPGPPPHPGPGGGGGPHGPLSAAGLPPPATSGGGGPIQVNVTINGLTGDITNPVTWDAVAEPISQALARRGLAVNPHWGLGA